MTTQLDMGKDLQALALDKSKQGREERIRWVRERLVLLRFVGNGDMCVPLPDITADDVMDAVEALGLFDADDDRRWVGNVLKGWELVEPTDRFVPSRRKSRHAAPVRCWVWK